MVHTNTSLKRYGGIDCHRDFHEIHIVGDDGFEDTCRFTADTNGLLALKQYAQARNVKCAVMESSGIYWLPVYAVLSHFAKVFVVNAADTKRANKKKTDLSDASWLAYLLKGGVISENGQIKPSYIVDEKISELRDLTRSRETLTKVTTQARNRIHKVLFRANIRVEGIFKDLLNVSGRHLLRELLDGKTVEQIVENLRAKARTLKGREKLSCTRRANEIDKRKEEIKAKLAIAITDLLVESDLRLLRLHLADLEHATEHIAIVDAQINRLLAELNRSRQIELLLSIPGFGETTVAQVIAEVGDFTRFNSAKELVQWAGLAPRVYQSGGKRYTGTLTKRGTPHLRRAMHNVARNAARTNTTLGRWHKQLSHRKGPKSDKLTKTALARKILALCWHLVRKDEVYEDIGYIKKIWRRRYRDLPAMTHAGMLETLREAGYILVVAPTS